MDLNVTSKVEQRGVLVGMLLGQGKRNQNNFYIPHRATQEKYVLFKKQLLEQITQQPVSIRPRTTKRGEEILRLEPKLIPLTRVLVRKLYCGGIKTVTAKFLNLLTPAGIALWFLDRGSKSFKKRNGKIHALEVYLNTGLSKSENEIIMDYFSEIWGFKWGLSKTSDGYRLRMGTQEGKRFLGFITPYVPDSLRYKVKTSSNVTATTYGPQV
ncbi:LAGLIDADG endonuclease [Laspinema olomoucense]|uniref:LAGLIDADG endonuclease n=1 Tax=Laspinema olomoucense TaxID=3231600 RepID=UPI0021BAB5DB|nr:MULTISPECIES: LAGLIDADG endonuclease [unclassified Laspinema]MCT7987342.1 DNA endonuclease [Laspinema sp. D3a]MCT7992092.1 DNA endonuclease [Laspinema sp. D3c]